MPWGTLKETRIEMAALLCMVLAVTKTNCGILNPTMHVDCGRHLIWTG